MAFQLKALSKESFLPLFNLSNDDLSLMGIKRYIVDANPGYPCRISLEDAKIGEEVLLAPYVHLQHGSPYDASGPIFVRKNAKKAVIKPNEVPIMFLHRNLSVRVYNEDSIMINASVCLGNQLKKTIELYFNDPNAAFIHIHNAGPGCFNCLVERCEFL